MQLVNLDAIMESNLVKDVDLTLSLAPRAGITSSK